MIIRDTKITGKAYCCNRMGYIVVLSKAIIATDSDSQGGVGMIVQE